MARVWMQERRLREMGARLVNASLERGKQMEELKMVPDGSDNTCIVWAPYTYLHCTLYDCMW